ncbi:DNA repair protein RecO [Candidatus Stoquefichus sp. SB1]|uniref:DNA repair protein RecO n=1 Tax=Candidatus Stoquefichus sp. SB1 TaxID=1658109 RepID=UPI00067E6C7F|nr:DNA repair protein RecO [Candidatus Stoquefichus sp. SB1]
MKTTINEVVVTGIILKTTPYKENDMILHIYTRDYGKIGVIARGVKKITSKNARACQQLMISELTIHLKKGLSSLMKATPIDYLRHIKERLESEIVADYILEYFYRYIEENAPIEKEYDILYDCLKAIDNGYDPLVVYLLFNVFILDHNGVSLDVEGCVLCGASQVVSISLADGGFLCQEHINGHPKYSVEVLKGFRHIHKISIQSIDCLHLSQDVIHTLVPIMDGFVEEYTGVTLKTSTFMKQIV